MDRLSSARPVEESPFLPGRLLRDQVCSRPSVWVSAEIFIDISEKDLKIDKKESFAWRRKHANLTDAARAVWPVFVGYGLPGETERVLIGAKRSPFTKAFLAARKTILPFVRVRFSGSEETADVYDPKEIARLEGTDFYRWAIFARTEDLLAEMQRMARGKRFVSAETAQSAWDEFVSRAFSLADREARLPEWAYRAPDGEWPVDACLFFETGNNRLTRFLRYDQLARLEVGEPVADALYRRPYTGYELRRADQAYQDRLRSAYRRFRIPVASSPSLEEPEQPFHPLVGGGVQASLPSVQDAAGWHAPRRVLTIPPQRPSGSREWAALPPEIRPLSRVDVAAWPTLLRLAEGQYYKDVPRLRDRVRGAHQKARLESQREARARELVGECIDLRIFQAVKRVDLSFGERLLIEATLSDGRTVYAVDSPNHGVGLYLFEEGDREAAIAWAAGRSTYREARERALRFIPHIAGWDVRAREALREPGPEDGNEEGA